MKKGREIMMEYCKNVLSHSVEHLESCLEVERGLINDNHIDLDGYCPSSYGLDNYEGVCYGDEDYSEECCKTCWNIAKELEVKEMNYKMDKSTLRKVQKVCEQSVSDVTIASYRECGELNDNAKNRVNEYINTINTIEEIIDNILEDENYYD